MKSTLIIPARPRKNKRPPPYMTDYRIFDKRMVENMVKRGELTQGEITWQQMTMDERFEAWQAGKPYFYDYAAFLRGDLTE